MPWLGEQPPGERPGLPEQPEPQEWKPDVSKDLVESYSIFREAIKQPVNVVYYPSCATDASPSVAFEKARVIYVDIEERAVNALKQAGYEAYNQSALEFKPDRPVDVLILLNPQIAPDIPSQYVREGGYVLCNDYHDTATAMHENKQFDFTGIIRRDERSGEKILDTQKLNECWKTVETDEEFKQALFSWTAVDYKEAADVVKKLTGKDTNILEEYKNIIKLRREMLGEVLSKVDDLPLQHEGEPILVRTVLPRKKGVADDLFVFQRVAEPKADEE